MGNHFTKKEQIAILIIALLITVTLGFRFMKSVLVEPKQDDLEILNYLEEDSEELMDEIEENNGIIMVHISGQVYKSGLVELKQGSRVIDAVELSGGLKKEADLDKINLAKKLIDEEKIYIPKIGEEINMENSAAIQFVSEDIVENNGKVDINNCSKDELLKLPGIGTVIADRILEYRETNPFKNIEELMNVSGIGAKKFEGIKELIITR